jgi:hypothetical protein
MEAGPACGSLNAMVRPSAASCCSLKPVAALPEAGIEVGAMWSSGVLKIDSVPSRLSKISIRRFCWGQSASEAVSTPHQPPPGRVNGVTLFSCVWPATYAIACG